MSDVGVAVSGKFTALDVFFSVKALCPLCLCGLYCRNHHGDTENTEVSQRTRLDTLNTGLLKYAVFF